MCHKPELTAQRSDNYSTNVNIKTTLKAILLNKVVVGKVCKMTCDNGQLTAPPVGYNSVGFSFFTLVSILHSLTSACHIQVLAEGGSFDRDELVVYTNDAIRPSYLVMYDA